MRASSRASGALLRADAVQPLACARPRAQDAGLPAAPCPARSQHEQGLRHGELVRLARPGGRTAAGRARMATGRARAAGILLVVGKRSAAAAAARARALRLPAWRAACMVGDRLALGARVGALCRRRAQAVERRTERAHGAAGAGRPAAHTQALLTDISLEHTDAHGPDPALARPTQSRPADGAAKLSACTHAMLAMTASTALDQQSMHAQLQVCAYLWQAWSARLQAAHSAATRMLSTRTCPGAPGRRALVGGPAAVPQRVVHRGRGAPRHGHAGCPAVRLPHALMCQDKRAGAYRVKLSCGRPHV